MILATLLAIQIGVTQPKVEIIWGKSNEQIRIEQQVRDRGSSYTGGSAVKLYEDYTNNCVEWSKKQTGIDHPLGNGARGSIQGTEPKVGAIGAEAGNTPHAFIVIAIKTDTIIINESNFIKNWISQREISRNKVLGYVYR